MSFYYLYAYYLFLTAANRSDLIVNADCKRQEKAWTQLVSWQRRELYLYSFLDSSLSEREEEEKEKREREDEHTRENEIMLLRRLCVIIFMSSLFDDWKRE